jgi:hypothetical protein
LGEGDKKGNSYTIKLLGNSFRGRTIATPKYQICPFGSIGKLVSVKKSSRAKKISWNSNMDSMTRGT